MDNIAEQLVQKKRTGADLAKKILISVGAVLIATFFMILAMQGMFTMVIFAVLVLGGGVWLMSGFGIEYEYIITNNEMDIDKIIGRRKRKRMITVDFKRAEDFAPYTADNDVKADATVHAYTGMEKDAYYLVVTHNDYGRVKVIFNPNERMREAIKQELPNALKLKLRKEAVSNNND